MQYSVLLFTLRGEDIKTGANSSERYCNKWETLIDNKFVT